MFRFRYCRPVDTTTWTLVDKDYNRRNPRWYFTNIWYVNNEPFLSHVLRILNNNQLSELPSGIFRSNTKLLVV